MHNAYQVIRQSDYAIRVTRDAYLFEIAAVEGAALPADPGGWIAEEFRAASPSKGVLIVKSQRVEAEPRSVLDDPAEYPELQNQGAPHVIEVVLDGAELAPDGRRLSMQCRLRARGIDTKTGETLFKSSFTKTGKERLSLKQWAASNDARFSDSLRAACREAAQGLAETFFNFELRMKFSRKKRKKEKNMR
jgi:hypothetical protein